MSGDNYDETVDALNAGAKLPDVRHEPPMRPTPAVVIAAAVVLGVLWQMLFVAFPDWRVLSDAACIFVAVLLNKWAHS